MDSMDIDSSYTHITTPGEFPDPPHAPDEDEISITIEGLRSIKPGKKEDQNDSAAHIDETENTAHLHIPPSTPLPQLWVRIRELGFESPDFLTDGVADWTDYSTQEVAHSFTEVEIVEGQPTESVQCIGLHERLIDYTNRRYGKKIELNISKGPSTAYTLPTDSLKEERGLNISFHRTIRMPDDEKLHQLPGSLGTFPLFDTNAYSKVLPQNILQQGGVFLPMWQREAMWINFEVPYPQKYAVRVFVGHINAISGLSMDEKPAGLQGKIQDYVVIPGQEWLDGICVSPNTSNKPLSWY